jgi:DNA-binding CsgD family transcriptional regulator
MAPHLSDDLRNRIFHWHVELDLSPKEIAALAGCSIRTVQMILRRIAIVVLNFVEFVE